MPHPHRHLRSPLSARRLVPLVVTLALMAGCSGGIDDGGKAGSTTTGAPNDKSTSGSSSTTAVEVDPSAAPAGAVATGDPVPSAGCGTAETAAATLERKEIGDRYYLLTTPHGPKDDTPLPVVVDLHGLLEGAQVHS